MTSEENILNLIGPLFLDDLENEFKRICGLRIGRKEKLEAFHSKLAGLRFLDPACGCGNFLVVAYRELRRIEMDVVKELPELSGHGADQRVLGIDMLFKVNVNQFYGIEIGDFPAQIAKVALWLTDHQMNRKASEVFGRYYARIPLKVSPTIVCGNALKINWEGLAPKPN